MSIFSFHLTLHKPKAGMHKPRETKLCTRTRNICGYSVWNLFLVTFLAPRIFR